MKIKKSKIALIVAAYVFLVLLLALVEYSSPTDGSGAINGSTLLQTIGNAIWYSIVTMTTVGYGDMTPHTPLGHLIGMVFMAFSLGLLTFLISWLVTTFRSSLLPRLVLRHNREKPWHVFFTGSLANDEIIHNWKEASPDELVIQTGAEKPCEEADVSADFRPAQLLKTAQNSVTFYCFDENDAENFSQAAEVAALGARVYFRSDIPLDNLRGMECYNPAVSCARQFWMKHPLQENEKKLLLIGSGQHLSALLEQALLVNIFDINQQLQYDVYGDTKLFREDHTNLSLEGDRLNLGDGFPPAQALYEADRIILCMETDDENIKLYSRLRKYHPFRGRLFIRLHKDLETLPQAVVFGTDRDLFTPGIVVHHTMDRTARLINELYGKQNPAYATAWEDLDDYSRQSNLAAADHLLTKLQLLLNDRGITEITADTCRRAAEAYQLRKDADADLFRKLEHIRWCRFLFLHNWRYEDIPKKDKQARIHPLLCPYEALAADEQAKDDNAWIAIGQIFADEQENV